MLIEEFMKGTRVCELARKHSLSYERVRQIIYSALKYNKKLVDNGRAKHVSIELLQDYKFIGEEIIKK